MTEETKVLILYGSQTGTAQELADDLYLEVCSRNLKPQIFTLNEFYSKVFILYRKLI
jgi:flavodoxin